MYTSDNNPFNLLAKLLALTLKKKPVEVQPLESKEDKRCFDKAIAVLEPYQDEMSEAATILNTKAFEKDRIFAIEEPLHIKVTWINDSTKKHLTSGRKIMRDSGLSSVRIDNENISNYVKCVLGNI